MSDETLEAYLQQLLEAHQTPDVMAVREPMGPVLEELTSCEVEPA